jgi:glycosyltransferase involved in cell wall biosynthesis
VRVALFLPHYALAGGLGVHCRNLLAGLLRAGPADTFTVLLPNDPAAWFPSAGPDDAGHPLLSDPRVTVVPLDKPDGVRLADPLDPLFAGPLAHTRPDVLVCTYYTGMERPPCRQAVVFHDAGFLENPAGFGDVARVRKATIDRIRPAIGTLVCVSADARERICRLLPIDPARTAVVWHALADSADAIRTATQPDRKNEPLWPGGACPADWGRYVFVPVGAATGFNRPRKNVPAAVAAFRLLARARTRLVVAGTGALSDALLADHLPAGERTDGNVTGGVWRSDDGAVTVLPTLGRGPFLAAMAHAVGVVYPTRYEGFGLPAIEAMALGVPLIAGNATSLPEVVGDAGLLVAPDDHWGFAGAMGLVLDDAKLVSDLVARGRDRVKLFSLDRLGEQMRTILAELAGKSGRLPTGG